MLSIPVLNRELVPNHQGHPVDAPPCTVHFRLAYKDTLSMDNSDEVMKRVWSYYQRQVPTWQKWLLVAVLPVLKLFIRKVIGTESEADIKWAMDKVEETLKEVKSQSHVSHE